MNFNDLSFERSETNLDNANVDVSVSQPKANTTSSQNETQKQIISDEKAQAQREKATQITCQVADKIQDDTQKTSPSSVQKATNLSDLNSKQFQTNNINNMPQEKNKQVDKLESDQLALNESNENQSQIKAYKGDEVLLQQQLEVQSVLNSILNKYGQFMQFQKSLNEILKFSPKPQVTNENDKAQLQYVENINSLKNIVFKLLEFPLKYNKLQNKFSLTSKDLDKVHTQLTGHIYNLLKVTYQINEKNLGSNYQKLQQITDDLAQCKTDCQELSEYLYQMDSVNGQITENFASYFGKEIRDSSSGLESEQNELKKLINEMECHQKNALNEYCQTQLLITQQNTNIKTHETTVKLIQQEIQDMRIKIKQLEENMDKRIKKDDISKESYLKQLTDEKDKLFRDKQAFLDKKNTESQAFFNQYQEQVNRLNAKYPLGKMCSFVEKKCFHYYFIQDESSSFSSDHQYAIEGVTKLYDNIRPDDYITYIKFDSSSNVNISKTQKINLSQKDFRSRIQNCRGGGTNFVSAFQALLQQIQNYYDEQEYPIVIFITDGNDSSNIDLISSQILSTCQDLVFYTIGYGSINEQCLKNITNKFNKTIGEKKEINGKIINLFYVKNTPAELVQSLSLISQQQSQIKIEDIKKAQTFLQNSFETMSQTSEDYYNKIEESYNQKISLLTIQIKDLHVGKFNSANKIKEAIENDIQKQNKYINKLVKEESQEISKVEACKNVIQQLKIQFMQKIQHERKEEIEKINLDNEIEKKQQSIKNEYTDNINNSKKKINDKKLLIEKLQEEKESKLIELGFQNYQHFKKFVELFNNAKDSQSFYINLVQDLISLIKQLTLQNEAFNQAIEDSQTYLKESRKLDNQYHVFTQFKQVDDSIDPENTFESTKKVLFIVNSSIEEKCKEDKELQKLYDQLIRFINLNEIIQEYVDKPREDQLEYIKNSVIPEALKNKQPKELVKLQQRELKQNEKIKKLNKKISNLKEELEEEQDLQEKKEKQQEIKELTQDLKELNKELISIIKEKEEMQFEFESENSDKILLINQVVLSLIQAVMFAFYKKKSQMAANPFHQLLNGSSNLAIILRKYKTLAIEQGFKN